MPETPKEIAEKFLSGGEWNGAGWAGQALTEMRAVEALAADYLRLVALEEAREWRVIYELDDEPHVSLFVEERWADSWIARMSL